MANQYKRLWWLNKQLTPSIYNQLFHVKGWDLVHFSHSILLIWGCWRRHKRTCNARVQQWCRAHVNMISKTSTINYIHGDTHGLSSKKVESCFKYKSESCLIRSNPSKFTWIQCGSRPGKLQAAFNQLTISVTTEKLTGESEYLYKWKNCRFLYEMSRFVWLKISHQFRW